ncbi:ribosome small subunit-dependent GTPase A [candidate division KSB1 bacterium]|nr:ribosome small subunit-dependent GTPase A [candidate division KSB1 bacterium]NIR71915.1 ribosome small subunit-dependent GTPase A [candidate division KSB1 bacterium]NIS28004.1 ribosome small subunit-dependent GTPase A [candidate division KSB1 bacterium]NIT74872.1 ribosome small subunit-dependent GTPase A [candidate division KSB1 bacterium]NIU28657.1 ribosome small subunit-dependent GTPase A [candidate division KSB1 bacterium]
MTDLKAFGWSPFFETEFQPFQEAGFEAGRVTIENRNRYMVVTQNGEFPAEPTGKLLFSADTSADLPKVGDWVVLSLFKDEGKAIIHNILPRRTKFSRNVAGKKTDEQIVATNIDVVFVVQSLDKNFNLRRLERYLVMVFESAAEPVIVLNKMDLCEDFREKLAEVQDVAGDVAVLPVSAKTEFGMDALKSRIHSGLTFALVGSSGVGKSTLINKLVGEDILQTHEVRDKDSKGRHTTSRRELIVLPEGGCLIDTPGMRELQLWHSDSGFTEAFADIDDIAANCHFSDCTHTNEIKCAVLDAVDNGKLPRKRYDNYLRMQRELAHLAEKQDRASFLEKKRKDKALHRQMKKLNHKRT